MNPNTNHLVAFKTPEEIEVLQLQGYELIPKELEEAANLELMGKLETVVGKRSTGSLSRWAKKKREKRKKVAIAGK